MQEPNGTNLAQPGESAIEPGARPVLSWGTRGPTSELPQPGTRGALLLIAFGFAIQTVLGIVAAAVFAVLFFSGWYGPVQGSVTEASAAMVAHPEYALVMVFAGPIGMLLTVLLAVAVNKPRATRTLNLARFQRPLLVAAGCLAALGLGELSGWAASLIFSPSPWIQRLIGASTQLTDVKFLFFVLAGSVGAGVSEEFLFRGYLQQRLVKRLGPVAGILLTSAMFGAIHIYPSHILPAFVIGIVLGCLAYASRSIWPSVIAHTVNNAATFFLMRAVIPPGGIEPPVEPAQLLILATISLPCVVLIIRAAMSVRHEEQAGDLGIRSFVRGLHRAELPPSAAIHP